MLHEFSYHKPVTLDEALSLLKEYGKQAVSLAGGTDLLVTIRSGLLKPDHVVDLKGIPELKSVTYTTDAGLRIGACATVNDLIASEDARTHYPVLLAAAEELATFQLRNRATVIGNVVTASPCGDMTSPLLCHGATITLVSVRGTRTMPVREFITGVKATQIAADEIVQEITVPTDFQDAIGGYEKLKRIKGHDLGLVAVAMLRLGDVIRVAISSAAPTPILLEDFPASATVEAVQKSAQAAISPIDDVRCTKEYRRFMVDTYIERLLKEVQQ